MSEKTETRTQTLHGSSESIELRLSQETEMQPTLDEAPTKEITLRSVDERIKQATDPILRRVGELCALLASRTEMESAGRAKRPVRGVTINPNSHRRHRLHRATTMETFTNNDHEQPEDDGDEPDMTQLMNAITNFLTRIQRNNQRYRLPQTP